MEQERTDKAKKREGTNKRDRVSARKGEWKELSKSTRMAGKIVLERHHGREKVEECE
jgi:hypothetical protein